MNTRPAKTIVNINDQSQPVQFSITIGINEAIGLLAVILFASLLMYRLYRNVKNAQRQLSHSMLKYCQDLLKECENTSNRSLALATKSAQDLSADFVRLSNQLIESNQKVVKALASSQLIPEGHDLISLTEGSDLYPLPSLSITHKSVQQ